MICCQHSRRIRIYISLPLRGTHKNTSEKLSPCMHWIMSPSILSYSHFYLIHAHQSSRKRRRVLKNNERLALASKTSPNASPPEDVQDQGFTRPSILIILPFRSSALNWLNALISHTPSPTYQIENHSRFLSEYGLPQGTVDKLASAEPGTYPRDHVETFKGNVDDNFRVGIKITKKSVKVFADFYGCDVILASPLGLRMSIEKEKCVDG